MDLSTLKLEVKTPFPEQTYILYSIILKVYRLHMQLILFSPYLVCIVILWHPVIQPIFHLALPQSLLVLIECGTEIKLLLGSRKVEFLFADLDLINTLILPSINYLFMHSSWPLKYLIVLPCKMYVGQEWFLDAYFGVNGSQGLPISHFLTFFKDKGPVYYQTSEDANLIY